ncbi:MAG TPA: TonB-dependent receptor, partial [Ignavibacteriaceae bacterium]|nr:TonB-dependent receptor [Ignavibacteriaceae bacterium]
GSFGTLRTLAMINLPLEIPNTSSYFTGEYVNTDGYFNKNLNFNRYNLFGKIITKLSDQSNLKFSVSSFSSDWDASGQIPVRAIKQGIINRFGSIDDTEGGRTSRYNFNLEYNTRISETSWLESQIYLFKYNFKLFSNFTFFLNDPINGDQIEQNDDRISFGYHGAYSFNNDLGSVKLKTTLGTSLRSDNMDVQLWNTKIRERLSPKVIADINQKNFGLYLQEELFISSLISLEIGLRGDYFIFNVDDLLNRNNSGKESQTILSPKANLVISPTNDVNFFINFGIGFHSNDARVVVTNPDQRTLPRANGYEIGSRIKLFNKLYFTTALWMLDLQNEFVFVGDEGTTEISGATRRAGIDFGLRSQIFSWLWADADINFSHGRFRNEPDGADNIPLAPDFTSTGGLTAKLNNKLETGLRYIHISDRPANETNSVTAQGATLFDLAASYQLGMFKLGFSIENIFDVEWNEAQFDTESRLQNEVEPVSELHFTPGFPRIFKTSISLNF